jgi:phosphohistidine phosphatase
MRLYIVRHAKAADLPLSTGCCGTKTSCCSPAQTDFDRPLTTRGRLQAQFLGRWLATSDRKPRLILASAAVRAQETAAFCRDGAGCDLRTVPELAIDRPVSEALSLIQAFANVKELMIVGHNPQLGELLGVLACGLPPQQLTMRTGDLVGLDIRATDPVGSAKIVERQRLDENAALDESMIEATVIEARPVSRSAGAR